ncbi:MAG: hypothetical protein R6U84_03230 [Candidatus Cloacimonadales bacterium]
MKKLILIFILTLSLSAYGANYYQTGQKLQATKNYVSAIEQFDLAISKNLNGARATKAELARGECYYALGLRAFDLESWDLAAKLFFLANSAAADQKLDRCYFELAQQASAANDLATTLDYYEKIIRYLEQSELIPEVYYNRILLHLDADRQTEAIADFSALWKNYREHNFTAKAQPKIDAIIPQQLAMIINQRDQTELVDSLEELFLLAKYTKQHTASINSEIAQTYTLLAEAEIAKQHFSAAYDYFMQSFQYDADLAEKNRDRIDQICTGFVTKGDQYLADFEFDNAIESYNKCFLIKPQYSVALQKIEETEQKAREFSQAKEFFAAALQQERDDEYQAALKLYQKSQNLINDREVQRKVFEMKNLIRAEKEPRIFAQEIVLQYDNGKLANRVYAIEDSLVSVHGSSTVEISGWKVLFTSNNLKYDVRYDIISPSLNFYFVWKVDLRTRKLIAMNKRSEELLDPR